MADVLGENAVGPGQDFAHVLAVAGEGAEVGARLRHEQRRADAVAGHVGDDEAVALMQHREEIKIVAARGIGGIGDARDVETGELRRGLGKKVLLDFAGDAELLLVFAQFGLGLFPPGDVADEADEAPLAVQFQVAEADFDDDFRPVLAAAEGFGGQCAEFFSRPARRAGG